MILPKKLVLFSLLFIILSLTVIYGAGVFSEEKNYDILAGKESVKLNNKETSKIPMGQLSKEAKILFAGDLMLDRYNRIIAQRNGVEYFTQNIKDIFQNSDLNVMNLEGSITSNETVSLATEMIDRNHFKFTFDKESTKNFLVYNRINMVSLGNNHILNFGTDGVRQTVDFLKENKIDYFGSPLDDKNIYIEKKINGLKIALVNYNQFLKLGTENISAKIKEAKTKNDIVIVYTHWGKEYELIQSESQRNIAHDFINSGADLIIGSHPHVVQPIEIYKNKAIFYSLGNFVFDQYFSEDVKTELIVTASLNKNQMEFVLTPLFKNEDGSLSLGNQTKRLQLLERIANDSLVNNSVKEQLRNGFLSL